MCWMVLYLELILHSCFLPVEVCKHFIADSFHSSEIVQKPTTKHELWIRMCIYNCRSSTKPHALRAAVGVPCVCVPQCLMGCMVTIATRIRSRFRPLIWANVDWKLSVFYKMPEMNKQVVMWEVWWWGNTTEDWQSKPAAGNGFRHKKIANLFIPPPSIRLHALMM